MTRRDSRPAVNETVDKLRKLRPEKRDDADVLGDSGDIGDVVEVGDVGEAGPNAVLSRWRDLLGRRDRSLVEGMLRCVVCIEWC